MAIRWLTACLALAWVTTTTAQGAYAVLKGTFKGATELWHASARGMDWESDLDRKPWTEYLVIQYTWSAESGFVWSRMAWIPYYTEDGDKRYYTHEENGTWWFANVSSKSMALVYSAGGEDWSRSILFNGVAKDGAIQSLKGRWMYLESGYELSDGVEDQRLDANLTKAVAAKTTLEEAVAVVTQDLERRHYVAEVKGTRERAGGPHPGRD